MGSPVQLSAITRRPKTQERGKVLVCPERDHQHSAPSTHLLGCSESLKTLSILISAQLSCINTASANGFSRSSRWWSTITSETKAPEAQTQSLQDAPEGLAGLWQAGAAKTCNCGPVCGAGGPETASAGFKPAPGQSGCGVLTGRAWLQHLAHPQNGFGDPGLLASMAFLNGW